MREKAILFDISHHGYGHLALCAPVVNALHRRFPAARVVLRTRHSRETVAEFVDVDVDILPNPPEATMESPSATTIDFDASASAYRRLYEHWETLVAGQARVMRALKPAAVVANVNPLSLAAAQRVDIPNIGFCCMNWLDIYRAYFGGRPEAAMVTSAMRRAYENCSVFLQPRPHMAMADIPRRRSIGPVARRGRNRREELRARLGLRSGERIVFMSFGGLPDPARLRLPRLDGVHWLMRGAIAPPAPNVTRIDELGFSIVDLTFSVDAVVAKDSYCTVVEAAQAGAGLVMTPRRDWPETASLAAWAARNCNFALAPGAEEEPEALETAVMNVLAGQPRHAAEPDGVDAAVEAIAEIAAL